MKLLSNRRNIILIAVVIIGGLLFLTNMFTGFGTEQPATTDVTQPDQSAQTTPSDTKTAKATPDKNATAAPSPTPLTSDQLAAKPGAVILLNPATGTRGSSIGVSGVGFDPGQTVDVFLQTKEGGQPQGIGYALVDQGGSFGGISFKIPDEISGDTFTVIGQQHDGKKKATAKGQVTGSSASVKLGAQTGKAGATISVTGKGFAPNETVNVYFNSITGDPVATLKADQSGGLGKASIKVPFGPSGDNNFIFIGEKSQAPVTVQFFMLTFYPTATISEYAAKADTTLTFSGKDFGPSERVMVYLNSMSTTPIVIIQTDEQGTFTNAGSFTIPFELTGKNLIIFMGEQTQSAVTASFDVLPYTPTVDPSTYGGQPGTSLTFYGSGFARNEIVRLFVGRTRDNKGKEVACAMTDDQGSVPGGAINYTIAPNAQVGKLGFGLVGDKSKGEATTTIQVMPASGPMQAQPSGGDQGSFVCPLDQPQNSQPQNSKPQNSQ